MNFIEIRNLSFSYDNELIFSSINETIEKGSFNVITSIAGEGKTTFLKLIAGLKVPSEGEILVEGVPISSYTKSQMLDYHKRTGFLFQDAALINNLNILDNLSLFYKYNTKLSEKEIMERLLPNLNFFDLADCLDLRPEQLSHGLQMIVSFIRAISGEPDFIILDEPLETLDQTLIQKMLEELEKLKDKGCTILIATHRVYLFSKLVDKVMILKNKNIIFSDSFHHLKKSSVIELTEMIGI